MKYTGHGTRTQRDTLHVIATSNPEDLTTVAKTWQELATKADALAEDVSARLDTLVTAGGWEGTGADAYRQAVVDEVLEPLRKTREAANAMAAEMLKVQSPVHDAVATARQSAVPWDDQTSWKVEQRKLGFFQWLGQQIGVVLGINDDKTLRSFNDAQAGQDYEVKTGPGGVVRSISKSAWKQTQAQSKPLAPVFHGTVSPQVNQFDVWMEYLGINSGPHERVSVAADTVEESLSRLLTTPSPATNPEHDGPVRRHALGADSFGGTPTSSPLPPRLTTPDPEAAGPEGPAAGYSPAGYVPPAAPFAFAPVTGDDVRPEDPWNPGTSAAGVTLPAAGAGGVGGLGGGLPVSSLGGLPTTSLSLTGTSGALPGAGVFSMGPAGGMPAGVGGLGAFPAGTRGGRGPGPGSARLGAGGIGNAAIGTGAGGAGGRTGTAVTGGVGTGWAVGGNPSFQMGPTGRGTAGRGTNGGVVSNKPAASIAEAQRGGPIPVRGARRKDDEPSAQGEETWLEEDQDVWSAEVEVDGLPSGR